MKACRACTQQIEDESIQCRWCGESQSLRPTAEAAGGQSPGQVAALPFAGAAPESGDFGWFYMQGSQRIGPVSRAELQRAAKFGQITRAVQVWCEGMPAWLPAGRLPALFGWPAPRVPSADFPISRGVLWLLNFFATPLIGAILYYVWKDTHPAAAKYANRVSLLSFAIWLSLIVGMGAFAVIVRGGH